MEQRHCCWGLMTPSRMAAVGPFRCCSHRNHYVCHPYVAELRIPRSSRGWFRCQATALNGVRPGLSFSLLRADLPRLILLALPFILSIHATLASQRRDFSLPAGQEIPYRTSKYETINTLVVSVQTTKARLYCGGFRLLLHSM